ncbi:MAG TPA: ANTAR domain-containing protein [Alphaproteobacteria bacterium]|nr:ANTAR domain-containing protein [Alphaproteobacteria bacterium]
MKILLADDNQARAETVSRSLESAGIVQIVRLAPGQRLVDVVKAESPDVLIVDMSRSDRDSLDGIREVTEHHPRPIVMFVDHDDPGFMEAAIAAGVSSYNLLGSAVPDVKPIVQAAVAIFRRYQKVANDLSRAETSLGERSLIQQAKSILMRQRKLDEPRAHRWLRQRAMNKGRRMVDVARDVIAAEKEPEK